MPDRNRSLRRPEADHRADPLAFGLLDQSGLCTLVDLAPIASRPQIAVIVFALMAQRGVRDLAKQNGAYECFVKYHASGEDLDRAIQRAVVFLGQMPKEDPAI